MTWTDSAGWIQQDPRKSGPKNKRWAVGEVIDEVQDTTWLSKSDRKSFEIL